MMEEEEKEEGEEIWTWSALLYMELPLVMCRAAAWHFNPLGQEQKSVPWRRVHKRNTCIDYTCML